jgi:hypothetical protein
MFGKKGVIGDGLLFLLGCINGLKTLFIGYVFFRLMK